MLILTRKEQEEILIAGNIRITVLAIRGKQVRLGIHAPPECRIHREELLPREPVSGKETAP